jgi:hypothetical protein
VLVDIQKSKAVVEEVELGRINGEYELTQMKGLEDKWMYENLISSEEQELEM